MSGTTIVLIGTLPVAPTVGPTALFFVAPTPGSNAIDSCTGSELITGLLPTSVNLALSTGGTPTLALAPIASHSLLANPTSSAAEPTGTTPTAFLDSAFGSIEGSVLYRGASAWLALGPGTSGQVLTSGGTGAPVSWLPGGVGSVTSVIGANGLSGTVTSAGTLVLNLDYYGATQGSLLYRGSGAWAALGPGSAGQVLISGGAGANPAWGASTGGITSITAGGILTGGTITSSGTIGLTAPAGLVLSNGSSLSAAVIGANLTLSSGTLSATGGGATVPAAGLVSSTGSTLVDTLFAGGIVFSAGTLTGGAPLLITDGTHNVSNVATLNTVGGTISGSGGNATLTVTGGGGGGTVTLGSPGFGVSLIGKTQYNRPALSALTLVNASSTGTAGVTLGLVTEYNTGSVKSGPITIQSIGNDAILRHAYYAPSSTSTPYSVIGYVVPSQRNLDVSSGGGSYTGITLVESATGKAVVWGTVISQSYPSCLTLTHYDGSGALLGNSGYTTELRADGGSVLCLKISVDPGSSAFSCWFSIDGGLIWTEFLAAQSFSSFFTTAPDNVGFGMYLGQKFSIIEGLSVWQHFVTLP